MSAAGMGARQDDRRMIGRRNKDGGTTGRERRARRPLPANPLFPAVLGIWGFALGGLVTLVLPRDLVLAGAAKAGLGALGVHAPFALAGLAAVLLGGALFLAARALARKVKRRGAPPSLAAMAVRHVRTIDPASELGSGSLDEPVETIPLAAMMHEARSGADSDPATPEQDLSPAPSLTLAEFAALPGRNAVWVEEPALALVGEPSEVSGPAPVAEPVAVRPAMPSAIERLRAVPPSELSLVQMVERFAAALHAHQTAPARQGEHSDTGRDAALAEALKALAALTGEDRGASESEPLREALARLQELRGAA
jgi:hypothetical protein